MEHIVLFAGPMGAGKTTAIQSLSDIPVIHTEAANSDRAAADKPTTTVAMDYGEIGVSDEEKIRMYGIPGQRRFDFMWRILRDRAEGMVLLVHNDAPDPVNAMREYLIEFADLCERGGVAVGITRMDVGPGRTLTDYTDVLERERPDLMVPVMPVDPRDRGNMELLLMSMIANLEMRATYARGLGGRVLA